MLKDILIPAIVGGSITIIGLELGASLWVIFPVCALAGVALGIIQAGGDR